MSPMSRALQIREYFKNAGPARPGACAEALGISPAVTYRCIRDLLDRGWLEKVPYAPGLYRFRQLPEEECGKSAELQDKLWRAMRMSRSFTAFDAAQLSEATLDYAQKYITFLIKEGYLEKIGRKGHAVVYRRSASAPHKTPRMRANAAGKREDKKQELMGICWELLRAVRDGEREKARTLTRSISKRLAPA